MKKTILSVLFISLVSSVILFCSTAPHRGISSTRLLINPIKAEGGINAVITGKIEKNLVSSLQKKRGKQCECILYHKNRDISLSANRQLNGSLSKIGNSLFLSIKVVDGEKSIILFNTSKIIKNTKKIDSVVSDISEEIAKSGTIWQ